MIERSGCATSCRDSCPIEYVAKDGGGGQRQPACHCGGKNTLGSRVSTMEPFKYLLLGLICEFISFKRAVINSNSVMAAVVRR